MSRTVPLSRHRPDVSMPLKKCQGTGTTSAANRSDAMAEAGGFPPDPDGDERRAAHRCRLAREIASVVLDIPVEEIARPNRSVVETCQARHLAIYLAHVTFQVSLSAIATRFGRDRTSVAHAVRRIEDGRDDPAFERLVGRLERLASACLEDAPASGERASR